ncbi:glycosyltransferase family 2 protein, partial [Archaeoglobales archaeon]
MENVRVSIVLPAYNEADTIKKAVEEVRKELSKYYKEDEYEIIIAE